MAELGRFAVLLAIGVAAWGTIAALVGARTRNPKAVRSAEGGMRAAALCLSVAAATLFYALFTHDFSVKYVAEYTSRSLSTFYTLGAFWAGQAGSLLLWAWVLSLYGVIVARQNRSRNRDLMPYVVSVMSGVLCLFAFLVAFTADPFERLSVAPSDGQGLNPLLQNPGQWIHPIALYLGFVGFTVPFAFAIASLATGNLGDRWIRTVHGWTLWSWLLLTAGVVFGARWAYVELGWGGYWAWDPVENASLMPWLTATAYLHSVMIQERKGMLKVWNVSLIVATFALSIFGTFITRSGVINSVHAFARSSIGPFLIGFVTVVVIGSGILILWRLPELRSAGRLDAIVSRESSFLLNNLLLVGMAFAVFWGTVFPLVAEAVRGVKVSVGPPFFEAVMTPMGVALLALVGFCPLLAWRKASAHNFRRNFVAPVAGGLIAFGAFALVTHGRHLRDDLVLALAAFVAVTIAQEFVRSVRARERIRHERWYAALPRLVWRNPRRYGGYVIHLGIVVMLAGIALHVAYKDEVTVSNLSVGQSAAISGYTITLRGLSTERTVDRSSKVATLGISRADGTSLGSVTSMRSVFVNRDQPATEVGLRSTPFADLYLVLQAADVRAGVASLALLVNPGVFWIWMGGLVVLAGGVIAGWPRRRGMTPPPLTTREVSRDVPRQPVGARA